MADAVHLTVALIPSGDIVFGESVGSSLGISELKFRFLPDLKKKLIHPVSGKEITDDMTVADVPVLLFAMKVSDKPQSSVPQRPGPPIEPCQLEGQWFKAERKGTTTNYEIIEYIGRGGQATVYSCRNVSTKVSYAVKVFPQASPEPDADESSFQTDLKREVDTLIGLEHARIVNVVDTSDHAENYFLVMDLAKEGNLEEVVSMHNDGMLKEQDARYIFWQLLDAVSFMHSQNIIHRDIKPQNILVESTSCSANRNLYSVKLADFGLAKKLWQLSCPMSPLLANSADLSAPLALERALTKVGTPGFCAPEIKLSQPEVATAYDKSVDYWSLGVCLYYMVTGVQPFASGGCGLCDASAANQDCLKAGAFTTDSGRWTDLSPALKDFISGLLNVDPSARYGFDQCVRHEWITQNRELPIPFPMPLEPEDKLTRVITPPSPVDRDVVSRLNSQLVPTCRNILSLEVLADLQVSIADSLKDLFNHFKDADSDLRDRFHAAWKTAQLELDMSAKVIAAMVEASDVIQLKILPNMHRYLIEIARMRDLFYKFSTPHLIEKKVHLVASSAFEARAWAKFMNASCDRLLQFHKAFLEQVHHLDARGTQPRAKATECIEGGSLGAESSKHKLVDNLCLAPMLVNTYIDRSLSGNARVDFKDSDIIGETIEADGLVCILEKIDRVSRIIRACASVWAALESGMPHLSSQADLGHEEICGLADFILEEVAWFEDRMCDYIRFWSCVKRLSKDYLKGVKSTLEVNRTFEKPQGVIASPGDANLENPVPLGLMPRELQTPQRSSSPSILTPSPHRSRTTEESTGASTPPALRALPRMQRFPDSGESKATISDVDKDEIRRLVCERNWTKGQVVKWFSDDGYVSAVVGSYVDEVEPSSTM